MARAIFNADDFGRTPEINAAVLRAHREGVLTSASLMVGGEAWEDAVAIAIANPGLAVGLHLVLVAGRPVLSPARLPRLVDERGRFPDEPVRQGLRLALSRAARVELEREMAAQFERFAATGLPLAHVDGHLHFHLHPAVFSRLLPLAKRYGAAAVRVPSDELRLALAHDRRRAAAGLGCSLAFGLLCARARKRLGAAGLSAAERVYGLMQSGRMEERYVLDVLERTSASAFELYFHPSLTDLGERGGPNPIDLATLLSPRLRTALELRGIEPATYRALDEAK